MDTKAERNVNDNRADLSASRDNASNVSDIPLVVEVDESLLGTDLTYETAIAFLSTQPLQAFKIPMWLYGGYAHLKSEIADRTAIDVDLLPMDQTVLDFMRSAKQRGRRVFLVSSSEQHVVSAVAASLGFIDGVFASDLARNLSSTVKRSLLVDAFGEKGFDYIGRSQKNRPIFEIARSGYLVCSGIFEQLRFSNAQSGRLEVLSRRPAHIRDFGKALRLHQWAKNLLIFIPLVLGGASGNPILLMKSVLCFLAFGVVASSTYVINDMLDLANDRQHPKKQHRPLASGRLAIPAAFWLVILGLGIGLSIGAFLGFPVLLAFLGYLAATLAYSLVLKSKPIVDVVLLAGLVHLAFVCGRTRCQCHPIALANGIFVRLFPISFADETALGNQRHACEGRNRASWPRISVLRRSIRAEHGRCGRRLFHSDIRIVSDRGSISRSIFQATGSPLGMSCHTPAVAMPCLAALLPRLVARGPSRFCGDR